MAALKFLDVKNMQQLQDFAHKRFFVKLKPSEAFEDLFVPTFWSHHKGKLGAYDIVRCVAHDDSFDVDVTVAAVVTDGIVMRLRPLFNTVVGADAIAASSNAVEVARPKLVPLDPDGNPVVRVEYLAATNWRVLGLNGEVSRDHKTEAAASAAMAKYLADTRLEFPSSDVIAAARDEAARLASERAEKNKKKPKAA